MKHPAPAGLAFFVVLSLGACAPDSNLESFEARSSYAAGVDVGNNMKRSGVELETAIFLEGIADVLEDREIKLTNEEIGQALRELTTRTRENVQRQYQESFVRNKREGETYLAENGEREGVITTESGLQYEVLTQGNGPRPSPDDRVSVNYRGTLVDGTEFDSSYERGEPSMFTVNQVIDGWTEGLLLMPVGSKYRLVIPSELAYGERGAGQAIGPNSTLIFEVELLDIVR